jgi:uncharacterized damage-inducible protein DinB
MSSFSQPGAVGLDVLIAQLGFTHFVIKANTEGVTHDDSLVQPAAGGNCLNWVLGHIVLSRNELLELLGMEPVWDDAAREPYGRGGPPLTDATRAKPVEQILADLERTQELLPQGLSRVTAERFAEKAPFSPTGNPEETVGSLITSFVFHDAYHAGQTGLLRRIVGRDGAIG